MVQCGCFLSSLTTECSPPSVQSLALERSPSRGEIGFRRVSTSRSASCVAISGHTLERWGELCRVTSKDVQVMSDSTASCGVGHRIVILSPYLFVFTSLSPKHDITNLVYVEMMVTRHIPQMKMMWTNILRTIGELVVLFLKYVAHTCFAVRDSAIVARLKGTRILVICLVSLGANKCKNYNDHLGWNFRYRKLKSRSNSSRCPLLVTGVC